MTGLPDGRKSFKIGLAVLIQYRRVTSSQPRRRSKYALYAYLRRAVKTSLHFEKRRLTTQKHSMARLSGWSSACDYVLCNWTRGGGAFSQPLLQSYSYSSCCRGVVCGGVNNRSLVSRKSTSSESPLAAFPSVAFPSSRAVSPKSRPVAALLGRRPVSGRFL